MVMSQSRADASRKHHERLQAIAKAIDERMPQGLQFQLVIFNDAMGYGGHVGNSKNPHTVAKALRDAANSIEKKALAAGVAPSIYIPN
ncbi:MAG: hypothetical protein PSY14_06875 [bacterium]|nr:hypothetical protein [bacterium]